MGRLVKFYKYGLNNVGWNKYSYIDIQFDNQIICRKRDAALHASSTPAPPVANNEPAALSEGKKTDEKKEKADSNTRTNKAESKKASKAEGKKTSDKESKNTSKKESKKVSKKESKKQ
jgi:cell division protein FtsQ